MLIAGIGAFATGLFTFMLYRTAKRGLIALGLTKKDMVTRATREARACAVRCCQEFAADFVSERGDVLKDFAANKIPVFVKDASTVSFGTPQEKQAVAAARVWLKALPPELYTKCAMFLNRLEGWAMSFTKGLADPEVAFGPCAPVFCSIVVQTYPMLIVIRADPGSGPYPNVVQLFESWYGVKAEAASRVKEQELLKELEKLQSKGPGVRLPAPLGTELDESP